MPPASLKDSLFLSTALCGIFAVSPAAAQAANAQDQSPPAQYATPTVAGVPAQVNQKPVKASQTAPRPTSADLGVRRGQIIAASSVAGQTSNAGGSQQPEIVINGIRKAYSDAVSEKRRDIEVSDGISADGLDRLPDLNIGEAMARLPGMQINRSDEGRDATVTVRGLPGEYALTTMNGVAFAVPTINATNPFGAYLSDIFNGVRIEKTPMANVQSGAIAGRIDLNIGGALDMKDRLSLKATYEYNDLGHLGAPGAALRVVHHFGDNFAIAANIAYQKQNFRRYEVDYSSYNNLSSANTPNFAALYGQYFAHTCPNPVPTGTFCAASGQGTGATSTEGVLYPSQVRQYTRLNEGKTISASSSVEWRPASNLLIDLSGFYTNKDMPGTQQYYVQTILTGTGTTILPQSQPIVLNDGRRLIQDVNFLNPEVRFSNRLLPGIQKSKGLFLTGDWNPGAWKIHAVASRSRANATDLGQQYDFETVPVSTAKVGTPGNGITGSWNTGNGNAGGYVYTLVPPAGGSLVSAIPSSGTWIWGGALPGGDVTTFVDSASSANRRRRLRITGSQDYVQNDVEAYKLTVDRPILPGLTFSAGLDRQVLTQNSQGYRTSAYGAQVQNLTNAQIIPAPFQSDFFGGQGGTWLNDWVITNNSYKQLIQPVTVYPGAALSPLGFNIFYADTGYSRYNFTYTNTINAGFVQGKFDTDVFGIPVRGNFGARYEHLGTSMYALTRQTVSNNGLGAPSDFAWRTFKNSHDYLLPSAIAVAELSRNLLLRAAVYKSYAQPLIHQLNVVTLVNAATEDAATGDQAVTVQLGNPDLHPYTALSQDLSLEWYNRPGSIISIAAFAKQIRGFIANITDPAELCPSDATAYGLGHLTWDSTTQQCLSDLAAPGTRFVVSISGNKNYDQPIKLYGAEFNIQQNFDFLPGPLKHLGANFNLTYTYNKGVVNGGLIRLSNVAPWTWNLVAYYETKRFGIRFTENWRSAYQPDPFYTGGNAVRTVAARYQLDGSLSYKLTKNFTLYASAFNILNARVYQYVEQVEMPDRASYDGRTFQISLKADF